MNKPNILIVMTDHQRGDTVLPEHSALTPNLDKFAKEGLTFTNNFCPSPHCCPARATFMSGLYPSRHGIWNNVCNGQALNTELKEGVKLFSEDLAESGYDLHYTGKWHVSGTEDPSDRGWTEHGALALKNKPGNNGLNWTTYQDIAKEEKQNKKERGEGEILRPGYGNRTIYWQDKPKENDENSYRVAVDLIKKLSDNSNPWCYFVGLTGPHDPYVVPQKYLDMYKIDDIPLPANFADELADKPRIYQRMRKQVFGQLSEREVREGIRHFWAYCTYLDDLFGKILKSLEESGQADNTLVLYCSDHGDYCGEHGLFAKGIPCFKGAYHVPAVVRWPERLKNPGRREESFVSLADFAPTFLDVAGVKSSRYFTGQSLLPFIKNEEPEGWRDAIFTQCDGVELYYTQRSVMTKDYKYVFNGFDFDELYDLNKDPDEMVNLAEKPEFQKVKIDLCKKMWKFAYEENDTATNSYITVGLAPIGPAGAFL